MKKFSFELEQILEIRNFEKQQAEAELALALAQETQIQNKLQQLAEQYVALKNYMKTTTDFADMISMSQNRSLLDFQKDELLKQLAEAKLVSEEKRNNLSECMKKTSALEKMKEIQLNQYKEDLKKENQKNLSNLTTIVSNEKQSHQ